MRGCGEVGTSARPQRAGMGERDLGTKKKRRGGCHGAGRKQLLESMNLD
jgi:hypothetical protein